MKMLVYPPNPNNVKVAELIRTTRKVLFNSDQGQKRKYTIRGVAEAVGISPTYYEELENNKNEVVKLKVIYGICRHLQIPINLIVQLSMNISDEVTRKHFLIDEKNVYSNDAGMVLKVARKQLSELCGTKVTQEDLGKVAGCSKSTIAHYEKNQRLLNDIRPLYRIAELLNIPMYVLIRNELRISDEEIQSIIHLPNDNTKKEVKISIPNDNSMEQRIKILDIISTLTLEDLETLSKILPAFQK